jgi:hypothetical protein
MRTCWNHQERYLSEYWINAGMVTRFGILRVEVGNGNLEFDRSIGAVGCCVFEYGRIFISQVANLDDRRTLKVM